MSSHRKLPSVLDIFARTYELARRSTSIAETGVSP